MGDMHRYRDATSKLKTRAVRRRFFVVCACDSCERETFLPRLPRGRWLQSTDSPALVELLLMRWDHDATVSKHHIKNKNKTIWTSSEGVMCQNVWRQQRRRKMHKRIPRDGKEIQR